MKDHVHAALATLERELEALDQQRSDLQTAISALTRVNGGRHGPPRERERERERERVQKPGHRARRSLPDGRTDTAILAALRAKSPQRPGELAKRLKLNPAVLRYQLKPLLKRGTVVATGATMNRQLALPRSGAAKEAP